MKTVTYTLPSQKIEKPLCIALVTDLHDTDGSEVLACLAKEQPDLICIAGDLTQRLDLPSGTRAGVDGSIDHENAFAFLAGAVKLAPTYYSPGNHEMGSCRGEGGDLHSDSARENIAHITRMGVHLLNDRLSEMQGITIAGAESGYCRPGRVPSLQVVDRLERRGGLRILLCHHPEYYPLYLKNRDIDLILSGHAHGGQIRLFGRGLFSPGQGIFPRYDGGVYDGKLVVGRGLSNTVPIPRLFNPCELVIVRLTPQTIS